MTDPAKTGDLLTEFFGRSVVALELAAESSEFVSSIAAIALAIETSLRVGGKLIIAGNGGSAADAQHLAAEFLSRFLVDRQPLPALALTTDTSVLTAVGNDYGFEYIFERQLRGLGRPRDDSSQSLHRADRQTYYAHLAPRARLACRQSVFLELTAVTCAPRAITFWRRPPVKPQLFSRYISSRGTQSALW